MAISSPKFDLKADSKDSLTNELGHRPNSTDTDTFIPLRRLKAVSENEKRFEGTMAGKNEFVQPTRSMVVRQLAFVLDYGPLGLFPFLIFGKNAKYRYYQANERPKLAFNIKLILQFIGE